MGDFEKFLPEEITSRSVRIGRILDNGLWVETYSGYVFELVMWRDFVERNYKEACQFLAHNKRGDDYGYVLTTTSEPEFKRLTNPLFRLLKTARDLVTPVYRRPD